MPVLPRGAEHWSFFGVTCSISDAFPRGLFCSSQPGESLQSQPITTKEERLSLFSGGGEEMGGEERKWRGASQAPLPLVNEGLES